MSAPERIWASAGETWNGIEEGSSWDDGLYTKKRENAYDVEYIRADLVTDVTNIIEALENEYQTAGHSEVTGLGLAISILKSTRLKYE